MKQGRKNPALWLPFSPGRAGGRSPVPRNGRLAGQYQLSGQIVISGSKENIEKAIMAAKARGAARALPIQVSGHFTPS